jgi:hypothetical protein
MLLGTFAIRIAFPIVKQRTLLPPPKCDSKTLEVLPIELTRLILTISKAHTLLTLQADLGASVHALHRRSYTDDGLGGDTSLCHISLAN